MRVDDLKSRVLPALLSGTRRNAMEGQLSFLGADRDRAVLNALSLTGQAMRFTRSSPPKEYAVENWPRDERAIVADELRAPILRLLDKCTEDTQRALALALEKRRMRPHPFDLPKLDGFLRRNPERLGVTVQYWLEREAPQQEARGYWDADQVTEEQWTEVPLRLRVKFLRELRASEAQAARKLLEKSWPTEEPNSRLQLILILQSGLATDDQQFLESIRKDRAPRVRTVVERLLATLAGSSFSNPAVAASMERIQKSKSGLLKKHDVLKLELPATVKERDANRWIQELFEHVTLDELARAVGMTDTGLVEAAEKDEYLLFALALMASREKRFELLATIANEIPDAWGRMSELPLEDSLIDEACERSQWAVAIIRPKKWLPEVPFPAWSWLHRQMEGALPESVMREVLDSSVWTAQLDKEKKGGTEIVQVMCALCPAELRPELRVQIEPLDLERKDKGWALLEILDALERQK